MDGEQGALGLAASRPPVHTYTTRKKRVVTAHTAQPHATPCGALRPVASHRKPHARKRVLCAGALPSYSSTRPSSLGGKALRR